MPIPTLSHLQYLVLSAIEDRDRPTLEILESVGDSERGRPGFYQLMQRIEAASLVSGRYEVVVVGGQINRTRWYTITEAGRLALGEARVFYSAKGDRPSKS